MFFADGTGLLNLAKRYDVHLSFNSNPLALRVQGLRGAVKQVDSYMKYFEEVSLLVVCLDHVQSLCSLNRTLRWKQRTSLWDWRFLQISPGQYLVLLALMWK